MTTITTKGRAVIVDLDGTIADLGHRLPLIQREKPDWDGFFAACSGDAVHDEIVALIQAMSAAGYPVHIVSARPKSTEEDTRRWLDRALVPESVNLVLLRGEKDYTPDDELKMKWLDAFGVENVLFVVDDRQRVVDMWRRRGLVCLQCRAWEEWKPTKGKS